MTTLQMDWGYFKTKWVSLMCLHPSEVIDFIIRRFYDIDTLGKLNWTIIFLEPIRAYLGWNCPSTQTFLALLSYFRFCMSIITVSWWNGLKTLIPKHVWKSQIILLQHILATKRYVSFFLGHPVYSHLLSIDLRNYSLLDPALSSSHSSPIHIRLHLNNSNLIKKPSKYTLSKCLNNTLGHGSPLQMPTRLVNQYWKILDHIFRENILCYISTNVLKISALDLRWYISSAKLLQFTR